MVQRSKIIKYLNVLLKVFPNISFEVQRCRMVDEPKISVEKN